MNLQDDDKVFIYAYVDFPYENDEDDELNPKLYDCMIVGDEIIPEMRRCVDAEDGYL